MAANESFKVYPTAEETLKIWERLLNHIINNLSTSGGYISAKAADVPITDTGSYFITKNVEYALQYLASVATNGTTKVTTKTDKSTLVASDAGAIICNSSNAITINLPSAVGNTGLVYSITNAGTGTVTIDPYSTQTIEGDSTFDLYQDESLTIYSNGSNWYVK